MSSDNEFFEAITPVGKFNFMYLAKPQADEHGVEWYSVTICWPKSFLDSELRPLRKTAMDAARSFFGAKLEEKDNNGRKKLRLQPFLRDGDDSEHNTKDREELFGMVYFTAKCKAEKGRPGIVGPTGNEITYMDIWSGCKGRVSILMGGYTHKGKNGIWIRLQNVQLAEEGERLSGRPKATEQFGKLEGYSSVDDDDVIF